MRAFQSLKHPSFALLWGGQTLSRIGDSVYKVALAWWVLEKTGSAAAMGQVLIFSFAPMLLFLLVGGVAVDRFSRLRLMLLSDLLRGAVLAVVSLLAFASLLAVWHVYVASMILGFVSAFFQPAYVAVLPEIVPQESLPSANSLTTVSRQMADILGPSVGAVFVALGGTPSAFAFNGLTFFLSAACLLFLRRRWSETRGAVRKQGVVGDLREGMQAVWASPWLSITIATAALVNITLSGPASVALPLFVKQELRADVRSLGLLYSMLALGSTLTAVCLGHLARVRRRGLFAYGALFLTGLAYMTLGTAPSVLGAGAAALVAGASVAVFPLITVNTMQEIVPRGLLGRVSSIDYLGSYSLIPVGYGLIGWAADKVNASSVFLIGGLITCALVVLALLHPGVRNFD